MAGRIHFTPTEADMVAATRDWFRRDLLRPRVRLALFGAPLAAAALGVALALQAGAPSGRAFWLGGVWALGGFALVVLIFALRYAALPGAARRNFWQNKALQAEHVFSWSEEALSWESAVANARILWADLHRWGEGPGAFLFAVSERGVQFVPRRALSDEQAADLRATALRHGPARL